jgi:SAM-dependent methyltransferase/uncharacterized protein YbaR (Trm112 family)
MESKINNKYSQLACPQCLKSMNSTVDELTCDYCSTKFPIICDVPLLLNRAKWESTKTISEPVIAKFLQLLQLPITPENVCSAGTILSGQLSTEDESLTVESSQFCHRVKNSTSGKWSNELNVLLNEQIQYFESINEIELINVSWDTKYFPKKIEKQSTISINFRVKNVGNTVISSSSHNSHRVIASGHWFCNELKIETLRTDLLVDLVPNAELTFPLLVTTPSKPGIYTFKPSLLVEGIKWIESDFVATTEIVDCIIDKKSVITQFPEGGSYEKDHLIGISLVEKWAQGKANDVVVELGGNFSPSISALFKKIYCVDIDLTGLQFAAMKRDNVINVCANGFNLPFPDNSIDILVIFASIHHFTFPEYLLAHIKTKLKESGIVALLCEPLGHVFKESLDDGYHSELIKGVNEQSFNEHEWLTIFRNGGFEAKELIAHGSSLKALLMPI